MNKYKIKFLPEINKESIKEEMLRVNMLVNKEYLSIKDFNTYANVSINSIRRKFGTWKNALIYAGIGHKYKGQPVSQKMKKGVGKSLSNNDIINEIKHIANLLGKSYITVEDLTIHSKLIGPDIVRSRFGSWKNGLKAAKLNISNHGKRYSDEECFENLLKVWTHYGRQPHYAEMKIKPSSVGPKAYIGRWGTWRKALFAFVEKVNQDIEKPETVESLPQEKKTENKKDIIPDSEKREIKLGLRYDILRRDRFKCVICGASPSTKIDCELHVDHIIPFSKGGKTVKDNLRTLCKNCNLGKSDKIEII